MALSRLRENYWQFPISYRKQSLLGPGFDGTGLAWVRGGISLARQAVASSVLPQAS